MVTAVQGRYDVSERYVCRSLGFERTAMRYVPLRAQRRELAAAYSRRGGGCIGASSAKGTAVNCRAPLPSRRARSASSASETPRGAAARRRAPERHVEHRLVSDQLAYGLSFRCFTVMDSCTREFIAIDVAYR